MPSVTERPVTPAALAESKGETARSNRAEDEEGRTRTSTQAITIDAPAGRVFDFVAELANLPRWAIGFAKEIREVDGTWFVRTGSGDEVAIRTATDRGLGVIDYYLSNEPGREVPAATRVVPNEEGAEYVFTMFQPPGMADEAFERQVAELGRELLVLKAHVESSCPL